MSYHIKLLEREFSKKNKVNSAFSLRSYAKFLDIPQSTLILVMQGQRKLPKKYLQQIFAKLQFSVRETENFIEDWKSGKQSLNKLKATRPPKQLIVKTNATCPVIEEWEHFAFISYMNTDGYDGKLSSLVSFFNLTEERAKKVCSNLIEKEMVQISNDLYLPLRKNLTTDEDIKSSSLMQSHRETLSLAQDKLNNVDVERRDYSSLTLAININKINDAKNLIRDFRKKMNNFLDTQDATNVYQLSIQFFPLDCQE